MIELNKTYNEDCLSTLSHMENESIDLVVTSPPYDNLRKYDGEEQWNFEIFKSIANELKRVLKKGGVIVWVVGDATIKGSETATSLEQAIFFKSIGLNLHDTMIYEKNSSTFPSSPKSVRYTQIFEYMFVLSKGKPKVHNLICDKKNKWAGHKDFSGILKNPVPEYSPRTNIWKYTTSFNDKTEHPAVFPEKLAEDHIITWSDENDIVYDPFMGSGTTAKMCILNNRNYIGSEISKKYCEIINKRLEPYVRTE